MIEKVIQYVLESAKIVLNGASEIKQKGNASNLVTDADLNVQLFLQHKLNALIDGAEFVGEESEERVVKSQYKWIIDPIDGTSNFVRGMLLSVISVGLVKDNKPILGVVYNPFTNELFHAEKGKGAYLNGKKIYVSDRDFAHSAFCTAFSLYDKRLAEPCQNILKDVYCECDDFRRLGSAAIELCYLAAGRVELYFEIRIFHWDFAASEIIILEAGGFVEKLFSPSYTYDRPIPLIASNTKENLDKLRIKILKELNCIPYEK